MSNIIILFLDFPNLQPRRIDQRPPEPERGNTANYFIKTTKTGRSSALFVVILHAETRENKRNATHKEVIPVRYQEFPATVCGHIPRVPVHLHDAIPLAKD